MPRTAVTPSEVGGCGSEATTSADPQIQACYRGQGRAFQVFCVDGVACDDEGRRRNCAMMPSAC